MVTSLYSCHFFLIKWIYIFLLFIAPPLMVSHPKYEVDSSVGYKVLGSDSVDIELSGKWPWRQVFIEFDSGYL